MVRLVDFRSHVATHSKPSHALKPLKILLIYFVVLQATSRQQRSSKGTSSVPSALLRQLLHQSRTQTLTRSRLRLSSRASPWSSCDNVRRRKQNSTTSAHSTQSCCLVLRKQQEEMLPNRDQACTTQLHLIPGPIASAGLGTPRPLQKAVRTALR